MSQIHSKLKGKIIYPPARSCLTWQAGQTAPIFKKDHPSCWMVALAKTNPLIFKGLVVKFPDPSRNQFVSIHNRRKVATD